MAICCSWWLFPVVSRCYCSLFLLLFCRRDTQDPKNSAAFTGGAAVFSWKNSEEQRWLAAAVVLP